MKRNTIPTAKITREEWLQLRRKGIGGSDASVIMGKNPYRSILQLWEEKTGKLPVTDEGNEYTYWGNVMEPIIRKEFMNRTGLKVRQKHAMIFHKDYPYLFADVDGIVTDERGEKCIFEAKTASQYKAEQWEDGVPEEYILQVQHYLEVCGMDKAYIAALIGGNKFVFHTIYRDEELIRNLVSREKEFWEGCVLTGTEPVMDDSDATRDYLNQKYSDPIEGSIQLQENMKSVLAEYQDVDCKVKELEKQKIGLANQIKAAMGEYETGEVDGTVVSWKKISRESLDSKRLRKEQPEVFAEYSNISSYRKLSVA
ncbi:MAG: YqaJ viral recombinase family protein [Blautia sp.]|uniref:YqaJ viral recombinase family nuclease n=1 Tax=Blautia sp. TaxID=1955243 RepID=UPI0025C0CF09|nr:YqaJ viral recombinase family protein [Blautia sp.]MCI7450438.1 YqaJ viral recombinase family protein [Blautia sp.]